MTIQETIAHLDELREQVTQGEWRTVDIPKPFAGWPNRVHRCVMGDNYLIAGMGGGYGDAYGNDNSDYIVALHNAYSSLRRAALAGAALAEAVEKMDVETAFIQKEKVYGFDVAIPAFVAQRDAALDNYKKSV